MGVSEGKLPFNIVDDEMTLYLQGGISVSRPFEIIKRLCTVHPIEIRVFLMSITLFLRAIEKKHLHLRK